MFKKANQCRVNGEQLVFNLNDNKNLDLWHGKAFKPKEVNAVQELYKDNFPIDALTITCLM